MTLLPFLGFIAASVLLLLEIEKLLVHPAADYRAARWFLGVMPLLGGVALVVGFAVGERAWGLAGALTGVLISWAGVERLLPALIRREAQSPRRRRKADRRAGNLPRQIVKVVCGVVVVVAGGAEIL